MLASEAAKMHWGKPNIEFVVENVARNARATRMEKFSMKFLRFGQTNSPEAFWGLVVGGGVTEREKNVGKYFGSNESV